jgi:hypothetical protein
MSLARCALLHRLPAMVLPRAACAPFRASTLPVLAIRPAFRCLSSSSNGDGDLIRRAAEEWQRQALTSKAPPTPRFPLGAPVQCRVGEDEWVAGNVAAHHFREGNWPEKACVPYQVLLEAPEGKEQNAVWAPADIDECIRAALRYRVGDLVQCRLGDSIWQEGTVVKQFHREAAWPEGQHAPYQVRLTDSKGGGGAIGLMSSGEMIWVPADTEDLVRAAPMG